ncbi:hypothetical protein FAM09_01525 [Niastella caeni]|uniref:Uncharacterized protein n=1 Tax=Niastella caeni TaxID=2569763 RepID=A0A4S8HYR6_9BACT|nr:hypothetical protein [Niastella caeni]THU40820.1 hypothetical protein FAM09_01525 [Niastella caeni]
MKLRNKKTVRNRGYKKKKVIVPRAKIKQRGGGCHDEKDPDFIPRHIQERRAGRMIRKMRRMAENGVGQM